MRNNILTVAALLLMAAGTLSSQDLLVTYLNSAEIDILNRATGNVMSSETLSLTGHTIDGTNGLSIHPSTGEIFVVIRDGSSRILCTVDRDTGDCTEEATFPDDVASIAFRANGTLYAITDDNATTPSTLFTVNMATGSLTQVRDMSGFSDDGEAIAFNWDDGHMYYLSGTTAPIEFTQLNLTSNTTQPINNNLMQGRVITAFAFDDNQTFWIGDINNGLGTLNLQGQDTTLTTGLPGALGGIAMLPWTSRNPATLDLGTSMQGGPGSEHQFTASGTHLVGDVTVTAPSGVQVSATSGSGFASSIVLTATNRDLGQTTVYVRAGAGAPVGPLSGDIELTTTAGISSQVAVTAQIDPPGPRMEVRRTAGIIASGGAESIGTLTPGSTLTLTYTIDNTGTAPLNITLPVSVSANQNCTTNTVTPPDATVAAGADTQLVIEVSPSAVGAFSFEISITNNDPANVQYEWTVSGTGAAPPTPGGTGSSGGGGGGCAGGGGAMELLALAGLLALSRRRRR